MILENWWERKAYWAKGGIIGLIFSILILIVTWPNGDAIYFLVQPWMFLSHCHGEGCWLYLILWPILIPGEMYIVGVVSGALTGWIIAKLRK